MRNILGVIAFVSLLFSVNPISAQGNDAIPACDGEQIQAVVSVLINAAVGDDIRSLSDALESGEISVDLVIQSNTFRNRWHDDIKGELPDCAFGFHITRLYSRVIDEMTIEATLRLLETVADEDHASQLSALLNGTDGGDANRENRNHGINMNDEVLACDAEQIRSVDMVYTDTQILASFRSMRSDYEENRDLVELVIRFEELREQWSEVASPTTWNCTWAYVSLDLMGRVVDEWLLGNALISIGYEDEFQPQLDTLVELVRTSYEHITELSELGIDLEQGLESHDAP